MLYAKDYRDRARASLGNQWLGNRWLSFVLIALIYSLILAACGSISWLGIGVVLAIVIGGPLEYGITYTSLKAVRSGEVLQLNDLFEGFKDLTNKVLLYLINAVLTFLWTLLFIIPGIIKSIEYSMSFYILNDNPLMQANDARKASMAMMYGHRWSYFCLQFSFIGWWLLSILTFGILSFWVEAYVRTANAHFYQSLLPEVVIEPPVGDPFENNDIDNNQI